MTHRMERQINGRPMLKACQVCDGTRLYYLFSTPNHRVVRCEDCGLVFVNPQPDTDELNRLRAAAADRSSDDTIVQNRLSQLRRYHGPGTGQLLEIEYGNGDFLVAAEANGWSVTGLET